MLLLREKFILSRVAVNPKATAKANHQANSYRTVAHESKKVLGYRLSIKEDMLKRFVEKVLKQAKGGGKPKKERTYAAIVNGMKKDELREECEKQGLEGEGAVPLLKERLKEHHASKVIEAGNSNDD